MMASFTVLALSLLLGIGLGTLYILFNYWGIQVDSREPPFVAARIPYIGHAIGLLRHGSQYWVGLRYVASVIPHEALTLSICC